MLLIGRLLFGAILRAFRSRSSLLLENLVLRQQLAVLKRKHPRPQIAVVDKLFWVLTRRVWSGWKQALTVVTPDTVVRWHREGFALYWRAISKTQGVLGRKRISKQARDLIFRMVDENPTLGLPADPWCALDAWIRCFRENHFPLDASCAKKPETRETVARLSSQSSRSHCCDGLFHGSDGDL